MATVALRSAIEEARVTTQRNLPAPPPGYLLRNGADGQRNLDFLAAVHVIWDDAARLREHSMKSDPTAPDGQVIADIKGFDASIRRRIELVETAVRVMREIWDFDYQRRFYDEIVRILVEELATVPDIQRRVIELLTRLNDRCGMTIHAKVD